MRVPVVLPGNANRPFVSHRRLLAPQLGLRSATPRQRFSYIQAIGGPGEESDIPAPQYSKPKSGFLSSIYKSLRDFGIGKSSIAEGGVGLFILLGGAAAIGLAAWAKGTALRKGQPYMATIEFPLACGITVGTPVRIRGVAVGSVHNVKPSLDRVDVLCEVGLVVHNVMHNLSPIQRPAVIL
eukprot:jgi/Chrzof1/5510/Cz16g05270.t1_TGDG2